MLINPSPTLFLCILLALTVSFVEAHDFDQPNRRHDSLKRMIRQRATPDPGAIGGIQNAVGDPGTASAVSASPSVSASASASADLSAAVSATPSASATDAFLNASASASASDSASAASVSASSLSLAPVPSSILSTSEAPQTTAAPQADDTNTSAVLHSTSTVTRTASVSADGAASTNNLTSQNLAAASKKTTITTVLIVVAASVAGIAILWTIFRKWKLGHSAKFDERMAPIDWQPTNEESIVPAHRLGRTPSNSSSNYHGAGALEHDFTAPVAHLAPVGGYADLARGPSPQPQMQETLVRGPSNRSYGATRPAYDTGVPLHHQAGYGNTDADAYDYNGDAVRF